MLIIGEKINTSRHEVAEAVKRRDAEFIRALARRQMEAGAHYIDVNCGTFASDEPELLNWMVREVQQELDGAPLCIDSSAPAAVEAALKVHRGQALLNASYSGEQERYQALDPLIVEYGCKVIVLCIDDESGIPAEATTRFVIASRIIDRLKTRGVKTEDIFVDPLVQPISVDGRNCLISAETIRMVRRKYPEAHAVCGLSNISFSLPERKLINQAFVVICAAYGLDAVILDPEDRKMMGLVYAAEALLDHDPFCRSYMSAYRRGILS
ncbi:MAG: dihydropteroate synthase [Coriobacteriales bacterium]|jgi:5-methyltetrahydrofolate--homocysteine methyltransferase|nr:dihydropteroate synthase [Coriobacteriales bacterium]